MLKPSTLVSSYAIWLIGFLSVGSNNGLELYRRI